MAVSKSAEFGGKWTVSFRWYPPGRRPVRIRRLSPVQTKRGAEAYERQLRERLLGGLPLEAPDEVNEVPLVKDFAKEWLESYVDVRNKASERQSKRSILDQHVLPAFGDLVLTDVTTRRVEAFIAKQKKAGYANKSINNHLAVLRRMLRHGVEWKVLESLPAFSMLRVQAPEFDFFDFHEAEALVAAAQRSERSTDPWVPMLLTALRAGLRVGELLALEWEHIDLERATIRVVQGVSRGVVAMPKHDKVRSVPIPASLVSALRTWRATARLRSTYVFAREDGSIGSKEWSKQPLWRMCRRANLREVGWHVLRHTYASHLVMRGVSIKAVQELLGHSDVKTTMRYAHLSPASRSNAVAVLDAPAPASAAEKEAVKA